MNKSHQTYFDHFSVPFESLTSSESLRYAFTDTLSALLQHTNHTLTTSTNHTPKLETLLDTLKAHPRVYQASMSRQVAADLPQGIAPSMLKDEPNDWFIKTADFGDDGDRILQHRDGQLTQLLEDLARYHQIFQEGYDRIIVMRPPAYAGYDRQLTAAMQCLGYTQEQFQFIVVQPIQLYAFHEPTQRIHAIPNVKSEELVQAIGLDALRWHSLRTPLTQVAPINISTANQSTVENSLYRVRSTYARCQHYLQQAQQQGLIQLDLDATSILPASIPPEFQLNHVIQEVWQSIELTPTILQQSADQIAPHLICLHLERVSELCDRWFDQAIELTSFTSSLLLAVQRTTGKLMNEILTIPITV